jgi:predicted transcriptional regulator
MKGKLLATLRGEILDFLRMAGMNYIEKITIIEVFYQYWKDSQIAESIAYLVDRGYVEEKVMEDLLKRFTKKHLYKITSKGIDILDCTIKDEGIIVPLRNGD